MFIVDYIKKLDKLTENLDKTVKDIVLKHEGDLLATVKLRLYQKSLDANLSFLGEYAEVTKKRKKAEGKISNRVTLRDTGAFYDSMFIDFKNSEIIVDATDSKTSELEFLWGEAILGLSKNELEVFNDTVIEPELQKSIDLNELDLGTI